MKALNLLLTVAIIFFSISCSSSKKQVATEEEKVAPVNMEKAQAEAIAAAIKLNTKDLKLDLTELRKRADALDSIYASLKRTPCYGRCPIYEVSIYKSGYVVYNGNRFIEKTGLHRSRLTQEQLKQIAAKAEEIGYFELENNYDSPVTDFPTTITVLNLPGKPKKEIKDRVGAPESLKEYEKFLDNLLNGLAWTKMPDGNQ